MTDAAEAAPRPSRRRGALVFVRDVLVIILIAALVSFVVKTFVVRSFYIPSGSMENTLQVNDKILVNELQPSLFPLSRGDVVVFNIFTVHGSYINTTDRNRRLVRVGYRSPDNKQLEGQSNGRPCWTVCGQRPKREGDVPLRQN